MTHFIGHRGAAGIVLENTIPSFQKAIDLGVQTIEFDVHATRDGQFVVCHDDHLIRVSETDTVIKEITYQELLLIPLNNGTRVPLLTEVLALAKKHQIAVIVEVKIRQHIEALCALLDQYNGMDITVASFKHDVITNIRKIRPDFRLYLAERRHPIEILQKAKAIKAQGIDLNYKLLNPLTYFLAWRWHIAIMVYTVDNPFVVRCIQVLYPKVSICTNHPERFILAKETLRT